VLKLLEDELFEKVWRRKLAKSGVSVISVLFIFSKEKGKESGLV